MDYELFLAHEQWERWEAFQAKYKEENRLEYIPVEDVERVRVDFFGQRYEVHITHSILKGIEARREFQELNK